MSASQQAHHRPRFALIAVIMFALLAVATWSAWVIVQRRTGPHNEGARLIERMRSEGLSSWWRRSPQVRWFLLRRGERTIGWQVRLRLPLDEGGFEGLTLRILRREGESAGHWEHWRLNSDATSGEYRAGEIGIRGERMLTSVRTSILFSDGVVQTEQLIRVRLRGKAEAPENYAPDGTLPLLMRMVAEARREASFRVVINEQKPRNGRTTFGVVRLNARPVSDEENKYGAGYAVETTQIRIDGTESKQTFLLNEQGETVAVFVDETRVVTADRTEVAGEFPEAMPTVRNLGERLLETAPARLEGEDGDFWTEIGYVEESGEDSDPVADEDVPASPEIRAIEVSDD